MQHCAVQGDNEGDTTVAALGREQKEVLGHTKVRLWWGMQASSAPA